jgi:hypothetical protein
VAIAVSAISALTRRRAYWFVGIALGAIAFGFLASALVVWSGAAGHQHGQQKPEEKTAAALVINPTTD